MATKAVITKGNAKPAAKKPSPGAPVASTGYHGPSSKEMDAWRARDDLRTLQQAAEIRANAERVKAATREADNQMRALESIKKS